MATEFTPEEIQRIFAEYNEAIKTGSPITKDLADRMKDASKGVQNYTRSMEEAQRKLGRSMVDLTKTMYQGKQGMEAMNSAVDAVGSAANLLINILPVGRLLKVGLTVLNAAIGGAVKTINQQSDQLFKSYQDLSQVGAGAADGMRGVFDNMQKFGYGLAELDQMTALIRENSKALSTFGGTVLGGTRAFADSMKEIQRNPIGRQFQQMGFTIDDINRSGAGYIKLQQMLGQSQASIQKNLTNGTITYMTELDKLARITGDTREAQEAKIAEAMAEDTFAATMDQLREQAAAGDASAEARLKKLDILNRTLTGEARQEFIKAIGGDVSAAQKLMMTAPQAYQMMLDSSSSAGDVMRTMVQEEKNFRGAFRGLYQLGAMGDVGIRYAEQQERAAKFGDQNLDALLERAAAEQTVTDQSTKNAADIRINQQQGRDALQSFVNVGVAPATTALKGLSSAAAGLTKVLPGPKAGGPMGGAGAPATLPSGGTPYAPGGPTSDTGLPASGKPTTQIQQQFMNNMYNTLLEEAKKAGVKNPEVIAKLGTAQSALETGYGKSLAGGNNYFGIKARRGEGGPAVATQEFENGRMVTKNEKFRRYNSMQESAADYVRFLQENPRYHKVIAAETLKEAIDAQSRTGYATDPNYGNKLAGIAGGVAGPRSGYDFNLSSVNPSASLQAKDAAQAGATNAVTQSDNLLAMFNDKLEQLNRRMGDVADNTKKTAQYAAA